MDKAFAGIKIKNIRSRLILGPKIKISKVVLGYPKIL